MPDNLSIETPSLDVSRSPARSPKGSADAARKVSTFVKVKTMTRALTENTKVALFVWGSLWIASWVGLLYLFPVT